MTLSWSLSPVRVAVLQQQAGRVTKKQRRMQSQRRGTSVRTHRGNHLLSFLVNAPLAFIPSSPCLPCHAHGAKRCNSTLSHRSYVSVSFFNNPRNKSILGGLVAKALQLWPTSPTNSSSFHYVLHTEPHLLPIRSDPPPSFFINCSPIMLTCLGIGRNGYCGQLPEKRELGAGMRKPRTCLPP